MDCLPLDLLDNILFRLEPKSLATMRCINISVRSHISNPDFESKYFSRFRSSLFHVSGYVAHYAYCQTFVSSCDYKSYEKEVSVARDRCYIFGSCSGLLLIYTHGLFVANPLTKRFRIVDRSGSKRLPEIISGIDKYFRDARESHISCTERTTCIGSAVNRATKRFKIVCILEMHMAYRFEISNGDSWRLSDTTITTSSNSDLMKRAKPVYLDGSLHWLRNDGSIIAFNPETEQACFIPSQFHPGPKTKLLFTSDDKINHLALLSGTNESISVYTLLKTSKWALARQIKNVSMEESELWNVVSYDGRRLLVREKKKGFGKEAVVHAYNMEVNSWGVLWSASIRMISVVRDFYKYTPSMFPIDEDFSITSNDRRIYPLTAIMGLIDTTK